MERLRGLKNGLVVPVEGRAGEFEFGVGATGRDGVVVGLEGVFGIVLVAPEDVAADEDGFVEVETGVVLVGVVDSSAANVASC